MVSTPSSTGPLGALASLEQNRGQALGENPDIGALASELGGAVGGGDGLASMVMGFVYPSLKPVLEASIRKVIVTVEWHEGSRERTLDVTQYLTNPQLPTEEELDGGVGALGGLGASPTTGGATTGTPAGTE